ncbi:Rad52/Rad22 family DNA repair protein [Streptomyces antibioticus]|uniref:Rad52/Rad22 family DNA repair protein n=1 Tax=Streptomyces antibioticus TaxID=1890 RepID=UPI00340D5572
MTEQQVSFLLQPISGNRVRNLRGMSHLEAWDVRRQLIRIFGFEGFTVETLSLDLVHERGEERKKKNSNDTYTAWTIVYRAQVRLTIKTTSGEVIATFEDAAAGDAVNQPSVGDAHDLAMKTALSQALKRCAVNLGDQFGLSLYNDGSRDAVVMRSLAYMGEPVRESEDTPVQPEPRPQVPAAVPDPEPAPAPQQAPPQADERQAALEEMQALAASINFADGLAAQFQTTFGHPIEQGTVAEFREATALMRGSAAA